MDVKTYLRQAETWRLAASDCEALATELEDLADLAQDSQAAEKLVWAKGVLAELVAGYERSRARIADEIGRLDWPTGSKVLYLRYVRGLSFGEIARATYYSYSYIRKLHVRALRAFERQFMQRE